MCLNGTWALFLALGPFIGSIGGDPADIGAIMGSFGLAGMVVTPAIGPLIERFGTRVLLVGGAMCTAAASVGLLAVDDLSFIIYTARVVQGLGFAVFTNTALALLAELLPPGRRAQGIGALAASGTIALALGLPIAEWLAKTTGSYKPAFAFAAGLAVCAAATARSVPARLKDSESRERGARVTGLDASSCQALLLTLVHGTGFGALLTFVPPYAAENSQTFAPFFVAHSAVLLATRTIGRRVIARAVDRRVLAGLFLVSAAAAVTLTLGRRTLALLAAGFLFGFSHGLLYPVLSVAVLDAFHRLGRPRAITAFSSAFALGSNLLIVPLGAMSSLWGYRVMFAAVAVALVAAAWTASAVPLRRGRTPG